MDKWSYEQNLKHPRCSRTIHNYTKEIFQKFITVSFNDKMMQLYYRTTKLFKNSEPLTRKALEDKNIISILFHIQFPKEPGDGQKASYKSETSERKSLTQGSKPSPGQQ